MRWSSQVYGIIPPVVLFLVHVDVVGSQDRGQYKRHDLGRPVAVVYLYMCIGKNLVNFAFREQKDKLQVR